MTLFCLRIHTHTYIRTHVNKYKRESLGLGVANSTPLLSFFFRGTWRLRDDIRRFSAMSGGGLKASSNAFLADPITIAGGNSRIFRVAAKMERKRRGCHCDRENTAAYLLCEARTWRRDGWKQVVRLYAYIADGNHCFAFPPAQGRAPSSATLRGSSRAV